MRRSPIPHLSREQHNNPDTNELDTFIDHGLAAT